MGHTQTYDNDAIQSMLERLLEKGCRIIVGDVTMTQAERLAMTAKTHASKGAHVTFVAPLRFGATGVEILLSHGGPHLSFDFSREVFVASAVPPADPAEKYRGI